MSIKEKNAKYRTILSLLDMEMSKEDIKQIFQISEGEFELLLFEAQNEYTFNNKNDTYRFVCSEPGKMLGKINKADLVCPVYALWKQKPLDETVFNQTMHKLVPVVIHGSISFVEFALEVGGFAEKNRDTDFALEIYYLAAVAAKEVDLQMRKSLLVRTVLKLSKIEFMRGVSPLPTLQMQREACSMVTQANLTAEDALLYLYSGVSEHFTGDTDAGATLREKGIKYLKEFNYMELEAEAIPLMAWHYYLIGDFQRVIGYYESFLIAIENRRDAEIITFAYPPVLFSYFFMGEYNRALTLGEQIYKVAVERKDDLAANLIYSIIGRTRIYMRDMDNAESILYNAYAEATELNYGWGLYYALLEYASISLKKVTGQQAAKRCIWQLKLQESMDLFR